MTLSWVDISEHSPAPMYLDINLGTALTHANYYYVSYGIQRVNGGKLQSGDEFMNGYPAEQLVMAGYLKAVGKSYAFRRTDFTEAEGI